MVQNIVTGGTSSTSTPILKFFMNIALLDPARAVRHMEHCPNADVVSTSTAASATTITTTAFDLSEAFIKAPQWQVPVAFL